MADIPLHPAGRGMMTEAEFRETVWRHLWALFSVVALYYFNRKVSIER